MKKPPSVPTSTPPLSNPPQSQAKIKEASARKVEANRRNARKSTGPRTQDGKARSALNALEHGLTAETVVLPDENATEFEAFRDAVVEELAPHGPLQASVAEQIAIRAWRQRRPARAEAALARAEFLAQGRYAEAAANLLETKKIELDLARYGKLVALLQFQHDEVQNATRVAHEWIRGKYGIADPPNSIPERLLRLQLEMTAKGDGETGPADDSREGARKNGAGDTTPLEVRDAFEYLAAWLEQVRAPLLENPLVPRSLRSLWTDTAILVDGFGSKALGRELSLVAKMDGPEQRNAIAAIGDEQPEAWSWKVPDRLGLLLRYEAHLDRALAQALATFERLKEAERDRKQRALLPPILGIADTTE